MISNDCRDWFVMLVITDALIAGTVYLFKYHGVEVFGMWCGLIATVGGIYHWLNVRDSKIPDATFNYTGTSTPPEDDSGNAKP